jgi:hypothetical protein
MKSHRTLRTMRFIVHSGLRQVQVRLRARRRPRRPARLRQGLLLPPGPPPRCHSTLSLAVIDCHSLGIYTVILLPLLSRSVKLA